MSLVARQQSLIEIDEVFYNRIQWLRYVHVCIAFICFLEQFQWKNKQNKTKQFIHTLNPYQKQKFSAGLTGPIWSFEYLNILFSNYLKLQGYLKLMH